MTMLPVSSVSRANRTSSSPAQQDVVLLPTLHCLAHGAAGRFLEIGAFDGITHTNTWMLERCFHWSGLLVEANPSSFMALSHNRGGVAGGPAAIHAAVCGAFPWRPDGERTVPSHAHHHCHGRDGQHIIRLVLSLDVEGSEYMVLATSDLSAFKLVMVEMESANERGPEREAIRARVVGLVRPIYPRRRRTKNRAGHESRRRKLPKTSFRSGGRRSRGALRPLRRPLSPPAVAFNSKHPERGRLDPGTLLWELPQGRRMRRRWTDPAAQGLALSSPPRARCSRSAASCRTATTAFSPGLCDRPPFIVYSVIVVGPRGERDQRRAGSL